MDAETCCKDGANPRIVTVGLEGGGVVRRARGETYRFALGAAFIIWAPRVASDPGGGMSDFVVLDIRMYDGC